MKKEYIIKPTFSISNKNPKPLINNKQTYKFNYYDPKKQFKKID